MRHADLYMGMKEGESRKNRMADVCDVLADIIPLTTQFAKLANLYLQTPSYSRPRHTRKGARCATTMMMAQEIEESARPIYEHSQTDQTQVAMAHGFAPAMMMAQDFGMMPRSMEAKLTDAPTRPNSTGIMTRRQNQRTCFSTLRPICGPLSPALSDLPSLVQ